MFIYMNHSDSLGLGITMTFVAAFNRFCRSKLLLLQCEDETKRFTYSTRSTANRSLKPNGFEKTYKDSNRSVTLRIGQIVLPTNVKYWTCLMGPSKYFEIF